MFLVCTRRGGPTNHPVPALADAVNDNLCLSFFSLVQLIIASVVSSVRRRVLSTSFQSLAGACSVLVSVLLRCSPAWKKWVGVAVSNSYPPLARSGAP